MSTHNSAAMTMPSQRASLLETPRMKKTHTQNQDEKNNSHTPRRKAHVCPRQIYKRFSAGTKEETPGGISTLLQSGSRNLDYIGKSKVVCLESEPMLTLPKKDIPKLGKTKKTTLQNLKGAEAKFNANAIMSSLDPNAKPRLKPIKKPRYAKSEHYRNNQGGKRGIMPHIEVLEVEGATLLGIPGTSNVQQFASYMEGKHTKQIVIAVHEHKPVRRQGAGGSTESDAAVMRSGVANLAKQLSTLRDSLAQSRTVHNTYANEAQKFFAGPKY